MEMTTCFNGICFLFLEKLHIFSGNFINILYIRVHFFLWKNGFICTEIFSQLYRQNWIISTFFTIFCAEKCLQKFYHFKRTKTFSLNMEPPSWLIKNFKLISVKTLHFCDIFSRYRALGQCFQSPKTVLIKSNTNCQNRIMLNSIMTIFLFILDYK